MIKLELNHYTKLYKENIIMRAYLPIEMEIENEIVFISIFFT